MNPTGIAAALREISVYLELEGERFRATAYLRAARSLEAAKDLDRLIAENRLAELPGVGASIAGLVGELAAGDSAPLLDKLRAQWPALIVELANLPGVGAAKARKLVEAFSPRTLDEVADLCDAGAVRTMAGFGKVSEAKIRDAIRGRHTATVQLLHEDARELGEALAAHLRGSPAVELAVPCGAARRWIEVIESLAIAVATSDPDAVRKRLADHPLVVSLAPDGEGRALARLASGVTCVLHTAPAARFGAALVIATGPEAHLAKLRARADRPLETIDAPDEARFYRALGLPDLPPEVRDGTDELDGDDFADLVTVADITGAVHCHTVYSDGKHTVAEMAGAAAQRGLGFLTITDHSQTANYAGGLTADRLVAQAGEIAEVQRGQQLRLLHGTESDIRKDGTLDFDDDVLAKLDVIIASIHNRYKLDADGMTRRVVAAIRHPLFKIWGHAMGRMLLQRPPIEVDFDQVLDAIADSPVAIEINGDPHRLDLDPDRVRRARARGARFVLSTDAHSMRQLDYIGNAVGMARRARLRRADVLNTLPPDEFARAVAPRGSSAR